MYPTSLWTQTVFWPPSVSNSTVAAATQQNGNRGEAVGSLPAAYVPAPAPFPHTCFFSGPRPISHIPSSFRVTSLPPVVDAWGQSHGVQTIPERGASSNDYH